jgi:hypothetical protein
MDLKRGIDKAVEAVADLKQAKVRRFWKINKLFQFG